MNEFGETVTGNEAVNEISDIPTVLPTLYDVKTSDNYKLSVNVSAVAGRNGAGKSSLMEFFFAIVYAFSVEHDILKPNYQTLSDLPDQLDRQLEKVIADEKKLLPEKKKLKNELKLSKAITEVYFDGLRTRMAAYNAKEEEFKQKKAEIKSKRKAIPRQIKDIDTFLRQLKGECYFQLDNAYYCLTISSDTDEKSRSRLSIINRKEPWDPGNFLSGTGKSISIDPAKLAEHFFYSIALNYSHYGLNSKVIGDWISTLFHKNDGYTTPLVLNPMRTNGNFDINTEVELAKQRMLLNVLREYRSEEPELKRRIYVTEHQYISSFRFKLNWPKINGLPQTLKVARGKITGTNDDVSLFLDFMNPYFPGLGMADLMDTDFGLKAVLTNYIVAKIKKIARSYPGYEKGYRIQDNRAPSINDAFLDQLRRDRSHITYKLNQAVHYFIFCLRSGAKDKLHVSRNQVSSKTSVDADFTPSELLNWMNKPQFPDIADYLPPSIFELDFELSRDDSSDTKYFFSQLSSGEQQLIHTFQSIFYHLNNIQSAHRSETSRVKYQAINIVFDEIELYFHPDYQRRFVSEFLRSFERYRIGSADSISSVNIILLTHSPFILSDIPAENILLLETGKRGRAVPAKSNGQTFAANINDLLANGFFLKRTLMGTFAEERITGVIRNLKSGKLPTEEDRAIFGLIGDKFLQSNLNELLPGSHDQD